MMFAKVIFMSISILMTGFLKADSENSLNFTTIQNIEFDDNFSILLNSVKGVSEQPHRDSLKVKELILKYNGYEENLFSQYEYIMAFSTIQSMEVNFDSAFEAFKKVVEFSYQYNKKKFSPECEKEVCAVSPNQLANNYIDILIKEGGIRNSKNAYHCFTIISQYSFKFGYEEVLKSYGVINQLEFKHQEKMDRFIEILETSNSSEDIITVARKYVDLMNILFVINN